MENQLRFDHANSIYYPRHLLPLTAPQQSTAAAVKQSMRLDLPFPCSSARVVNFRQKTYRNITASLIDYRSELPMELEIGAPNARMVVLMEEVGDRAEIRVDARFRAVNGRGAAQNISVFRPGEQAYLCAQRMRFLRLLMLTFHDEEPEAEDSEARRGFASRRSFTDASLQHLAELFAADLLDEDGEGFGEGLISPLLSRLTQLSDAAPEPMLRGGLVSWQVRRVSELMQAQLSAQLTLQQLAASIGMSRSHFCRAFRASIGVPPHQWHLQMRVAKAKELLLGRVMPLSEIALTVGFADQAHFNRTFRRAVGVTPGLWQRSNAC